MLLRTRDCSVISSRVRVLVPSLLRALLRVWLRSIIEKQGFVFALHLDVEAIDGTAVAFAALSDQRLSPLRPFDQIILRISSIRPRSSSLPSPFSSWVNSCAGNCSQ